jgi:hypothetical protein
MFRHRKIKVNLNVPHTIKEDVEVENVDENGVSTVSYVKRDVLESAHGLPDYSDYQLSDLIAAGVNLKPVAADVLTTKPTDEELDTILDEFDKEYNDLNQE